MHIAFLRYQYRNVYIYFLYLLHCRYRHDLAMPPEEYSPLQQLLLDPELHVVRALADVCHLDRVPLANSLLRIFRYINKNITLYIILNILFFFSFF